MKMRLWNFINLLLLTFVNADSCIENLVQVGSFIGEDDFERCNQKALIADSNGDLRLSVDEYGSFINQYSEGALKNVTFSELPLRLITIFNWISCFCVFEPDGDRDCCIGSRSGINLDSSRESEQTLRLFCSQTNEAIHTIAGTPSPSESILSTPSSIPSVEFDLETKSPSIAPSISTSHLPSNLDTSVPSSLPTVSYSPTSEMPSDLSNQPTYEGTFCIKFQYSLRNELNLTADAIFNEVNNTLKSRLLIATGITVTKVLNTSYPEVNRIGAPIVESNESSMMPDLSHVISIDRKSRIESDETIPQFWDWRFRRLVSPIESNLKNKISYLRAAFHEKSEDTVGNLKYHKHSGFTPGTIQRRRLVIFRDDVPATIQSISDAPLLLCPGNSKEKNFRCTIVSSTVCLILNENDDESQVRNIVIQGLAEAIDNGEFEANIPLDLLP